MKKAKKNRKEKYDTYIMLYKKCINIHLKRIKPFVFRLFAFHLFSTFPTEFSTILWKTANEM